MFINSFKVYSWLSKHHLLWNNWTENAGTNQENQILSENLICWIYCPKKIFTGKGCLSPVYWFYLWKLNSCSGMPHNRLQRILRPRGCMGGQLPSTWATQIIICSKCHAREATRALDLNPSAGQPLSLPPHGMCNLHGCHSGFDIVQTLSRIFTVWIPTQVQIGLHPILTGTTQTVSLQSLDRLSYGRQCLPTWPRDPFTD